MRTSVIILILLLLCGLFAGCYTMLVHPRTEGTDDWHQTRRHCSDCHGSADYYYWHGPYYNNWYWGQRSWRSYYYDPWWWNDYWYWYDDDGEPVKTEPPHYYDEQVRPKPEGPGLAPGDPTATQQDVKPSTPGGTTIGNEPVEKQQPAKTDPQYYKPQPRPKPQEKPKQPEKKKKQEKAEEDN